MATRYAAGVWCAGSMILGVTAASAQPYPARTIRIVAAAAGGPTDLVARVIAQNISAPLGRPVIVDNRAVGVMAEHVAKEPADGYTLLVSGANLWLSPFMRDKSPYDPVKDFAPISLAVQEPTILVVHPSVPAKSIREFIILAKSRPGELNYASGATGSSNHLAAELFKSMAGINVVRIPYKGGGPAVIDLIAGQVQIMFASPGGVLQHVKSARLKALAVTSAQPSGLAPGLPTVAASGVPGYESGAFFAVFAAAKTPAAIISRLHQEIVRALNSADVKARLFDTGSEVVGNSPEQLAEMMRSQMIVLGKVISDAGIRE